LFKRAIFSMLHPSKEKLTNCLGLIGSATASDVEVYWTTIRLEGEKSLGPGNSAEMAMYCLPTGVLRRALAENDWDRLTPVLIDAGLKLHRVGAEALVICGSALNPAAPRLREALGIPVVDICRSVEATVLSLKYRRVAVLGIRSQFEREMWTTGLEGHELIFPNAGDALWLVERADEAIGGNLPTADWKIETNRIVSDLRRGGAQVLVLADPTLGRWIRTGDSLLFPIDAAEIHAWVAGMWAVHPLETAPPCIIRTERPAS
jgi:aspartate/glutamate racemase